MREMVQENRLPRYTIVVALVAVLLIITLRDYDATMAAASRGSGEYTIIDLEFGGRSWSDGGETFDRIMKAWVPDSVESADGQAAAKRSLWIDFLFIATYFVLLESWTRRLGWRSKGGCGRRMANLPCVIAGCDMLENAALLIAVYGWSSGSPTGSLLPWVAAWFAIAKFALLLLWVVTLLVKHRVVPYLFLSRVPLLGLMVIAIVLPAVMPSSPLLSNLLLLESWQQAMEVGFALGMTSLCCVSTAILGIRYAPLRFGVRPLVTSQSAIYSSGISHVWQIGIATCASLPLATLLRDDGDLQGPGMIFLATMFGVGVGFGAMVFTQFIMERWRRERNETVLDGRRYVRLDRSLFGGYLRPERNRVIDRDDPTRTRGVFRKLLPGHFAAMVSLSVLVIAYIAAALFFEPERPTIDHVPVLVDILFIIAVSVSLLAGAAFLLDRYRVPLMLLVFAWTFAFGLLTKSTHYFELIRTPTGTTPVVLATPHDLVRDAVSELKTRTTDPATRGDSLEPAVIIVCAAGGGIQAAGWTAKVLTSLDAYPDLPGAATDLSTTLDFRDRLVFVSGVSGGSVGAMHYLEAVRRRVNRLRPEDRSTVVDAAMRSSLNAVGWAMAFKDLRRPLGLMIDRAMDRSIAMEAVWQRSLPIPVERDGDSNAEGTLLNAHLSDWARATRLGQMPGVCLNATLAGVGERPQKGRRLLLSTVAIDPKEEGTTRHPREFFDVYPLQSDQPEEGSYDIAVTTAARLSATFPYVTPMARAGELIDGEMHDVAPGHYVGDGGYFDNFGFVTAVEFILAARAEIPTLRVAVVIIQSFPDVELGERTSTTAAWQNALYGPVDLLLSTWSNTQVVRQGVETELLKLAMEDRVRVCRFVIEGEEGMEPPLSWHLSSAQKRAIRDGFGVQNQELAAKLHRWVVMGEE